MYNFEKGFDNLLGDIMMYDFVIFVLALQRSRMCYREGHNDSFCFVHSLSHELVKHSSFFGHAKCTRLS